MLHHGKRLQVLDGAVLLAWRRLAGGTLAAFLAASVRHFGTGDTGGGGVPALLRGGLPAAVPRGLNTR